MLKTRVFDMWQGTLGELSRTTGIPLATLSRVRSGSRQPGADFQARMIATFSKRWDELFFYAEQPAA